MKKVDKETYMEAFKQQELKPISSFSDPDGGSDALWVW
jgi:hypothetical protein